MRKKWYLWAILTIGIIIIAGGAYWLVNPDSLSKVTIPLDEPKYTQTEVIALVKRDLSSQGVESREIDSVQQIYGFLILRVDIIHR